MKRSREPIHVLLDLLEGTPSETVVVLAALERACPAFKVTPATGPGSEAQPYIHIRPMTPALLRVWLHGLLRTTPIVLTVNTLSLMDSRYPPRGRVSQLRARPCNGLGVAVAPTQATHLGWTVLGINGQVLV